MAADCADRLVGSASATGRHRRKRRWRAWLGLAVLLAAGAAPIAHRAVVERRRRLHEIRFRNLLGNFRNVGLYVRLFRRDYDRYPDFLWELVDENYIHPIRGFFAMYSVEHDPYTLDDMRRGRCDFAYLGRGMRHDEERADSTVLAYTKPGLSPLWMGFLFQDGHVTRTHAGSPAEIASAHGWILRQPPGTLSDDPRLGERYRRLDGERFVVDLSWWEGGCDAELAGLAATPDIQELSLYGQVVTDAGLVHLASLSRLESLDLRRTNVTGPGLAHLTGLQSLRVLNLSRTEVGDAGVSHLGALHELRVLDLSSTEVGDSGLVAIAGLPKLERLSLDKTHITDDGLRRLRQVPSLRAGRFEDTRTSAEARAEFRQWLSRP